LQNFSRVAALDVLHHDVAVLVLDHRVEDLHDVRVVQLAGERGLVQEHALVHRRVLVALERLGERDLDGDLAFGERIVGEIDLGGGALAELAHQLVLPDGLHRGHGRPA